MDPAMARFEVPSRNPTVTDCWDYPNTRSMLRLMSTGIGDRVRDSIPAHVSQRKLAPEVGMTHDALSRALNGQRHFSAIELASLAERLNVDTHWLITGQQDPFKVRLAARHLWNQGSPEQQDGDDQIIARVVDAYRTAYADAGAVPSALAALPADPATLRKLLLDTDTPPSPTTPASPTSPEYGRVDKAAGAGMRYLADQIHHVLSIDVVRDPGLQTDYSFRIGDHAVVLLKSTIAWFRANWSIAHELGHLALGHHVGDRARTSDEAPANEFAAEFLAPAEQIRQIDWTQMSGHDFALWLWDAGVSTHVMRTRFRQLDIEVSTAVREALQFTTPQLMRAHVAAIRSHTPSHGDPIWERENATTGRQFPEHVVTALTERVEAGTADPHILAWVREVPVDDLEWPEPDTDTFSSDCTDRTADAEQTDWFGLLDAR